MPKYKNKGTLENPQWIDPEEIFAEKEKSNWCWYLLGAIITYFVCRILISLIFKI